MNRICKRMVFLFVMIVLLSSSLFAAKQEHWLFSGFDYDFTFISSSGADLKDLVDDDNIAYFNSFGFDVTWYGFFGKDTNVGAYMSLGFLFPMDNASKNNNADQSGNDVLTREQDFVFSILLGPAFRLRCTNKLDMYFGIGFSFAHYTKSQTNTQDITNTESLTSMGLGADVGFKLEVTPRVCFRSGVAVSYDFATLYIQSRYSSNNPADKTGTSTFSLYNGFSLNPYIGMGITFKTRHDKVQPKTVSLVELAAQ